MTTPKIYVGTYAKYASGSLDGEWVELDEYGSLEDFIDYCTDELHGDELDPELMFQDWEGIPEGYISESSLSSEYFVFAELTAGWKDERLEAIHIYGDYSGWGWDDAAELVEKFEEAYQGKFDHTHYPKREFAWELADDLGYLKAMEKAGLNASYFDVEAFARDLFIGDYFEVDYHIFLRHV